MSSQSVCQLLTREEAARVLKVSLGTLDKLVNAKTLPRPRALPAGRRLYFRHDEFYTALNTLLPAVAGTDAIPPAIAVAIPQTSAIRSTTSSGRRASSRGSAASRARRRDAERLALLNSPT